MKIKKSSFFIGFAVIVLVAIALIIVFGLPRAAAACDYVYNPCGSSYGHSSYPQTVQYPIPRYVYFQDPARYYNDTYTPVIYPMPLYVQTGVNPSTVNYGTYSQQYPSLSYVPVTSRTNTPAYGNYSYPTTSYNQPYSNYNTGFSMGGGSQAGQGGTSASGFINTSGR
ncbi:MAG: hypothetical protein V4664_02625 [Patescibacteria group bacterium]